MENRNLDSGRASEFERLYAIAPIGLCYLDASLRFRYINEWLARLNGLPVEAHLGKTIDEVVVGVAAVIASQLRYVIQTGDALIDGEVEAETPAHPGESRYYMHNYLPDMSNDGMVVGVSCVVQDITELRQTEEALRESEIMFKQAARTARLGHWKYDEVTESYLSISEEYARIFGYTVDEFVQRFNTYDEDIVLVHPEDRARVAEAYKTNERPDVEYRIVRADGCERFVHEITRQSRDEDGRLVETMGTLQDITDIKRTEFDLLASKGAANRAK